MKHDIIVLSNDIQSNEIQIDDNGVYVSNSVINKLGHKFQDNGAKTVAKSCSISEIIEFYKKTNQLLKRL